MSLLSPTSVAVIGASTQPGKVGHDIFRNLATQGFGGALYPINPKPGEICGHATIPSIADVPGPVDLAIIVTPAPTVAGLLRACAAKGVQTVVVISAGFAEVHTDEGRAMEAELKKIAKEAKIDLIGPNCLGILRPSIGLNASFAKDMPPAGGIALVSQSGATAVGLMDGATEFGLGFSAVLSIGNKTVLDECDYVERCGKDPETKVIGLYLESIKDGRRFLRIAREVTAKKPIVLLKAGVSAKGGKAASSHTGALAGSDAGVEALCLQAGIRRAHDTEHFLDLLAVLSTQPALPAPRIAIVTNAGGPGILATDAAEALGLQMPSLSEKTAAGLKAALPPTASIGNPVDVIGDAGTDRYSAAIQACARDPEIEGIVALLTPQVMTPCDEIAEAIVAVNKKNKLLPITTSFIGGASVENARMILRRAGIPTFPTPERAVRAIAALQPPSPPSGGEGRGEGVTNAAAQKLLSGRQGLLPEDATRALFTLYDIPLPKQGVAKTEDEAAALFRDIGGAVIAKIQGKDILHKTDIGGISGKLTTEAEVRAAFRTILANVKKHLPKAQIDGVLVQQFIDSGDEVIVGAVRDPAFGTLIMTGLGGIYTELFRDTAFRMAPITEEDAYGMLQHLASWKMFLGLRGKPQADIDALARLIARIAQMVTDCPAIAELDLNPVLVSDKGVIIADAKVILTP